MQVASAYSSALPHSHYHNYYQLQPQGPQDPQLKRQYLALLPPQQIIEICLTFDVHVPPYVKSTIWPPDLSAAIAALQKSMPPTSAGKKSDDILKDSNVIMDSLKSPSEVQESSSSQPERTPTVEPQPPDKESTSTPGLASAADATSEASSSATQIAENTPSVTPDQPQPTAASATIVPTVQPQATPPAQPVPPVTAQPAYPHQPYGYGHPPAAYPHTPYYQQHPVGYSYYGYPPMQNGYHHPQPAPTYPPQSSHYNTMVPLSQHPQQEGAATDDLPSYEEMIVEALTDCTDSEGWAPKDLFTWMASRYPLQSNFRPSASQALQKAYKRGRFEKGSNGRYRLNGQWEGGNTSRRTTRRPQTQSTLLSSNGASSTPAPPFTNAPLVHHNSHSMTSSHTAAQPQYPAQPYGYPYAGYPGYSAQPQASTSTLPGTAAGATAPAEKTVSTAGDTDSAAAYEAAQTILKAINFGGLLQLPQEEQNERKEESLHPPSSQQFGDGVEHLLSHVQAALASSNAVGAGGVQSNQQPLPSPDPRAELQAQLALLAAQLAEFAQAEDHVVEEDARSGPSFVAPLSPTSLPAPVMNSLIDTPPLKVATSATTVTTQLVPESHHTPPALPTAPALPPPPLISAVSELFDLSQTQLQEQEESDDDDMEEVI